MENAPQTPIKPIILGECEFLGGCIRVRISVKNRSDRSILDTELELKSDKDRLSLIRCEYPEKKGKIQLGTIDPGADRTITFYLDPLICANASIDINSIVSFKDSFGMRDSAQMETLKIKVVCPILRTEQEINIVRLKILTEELQFKDSLVYIFPGGIELQDILISCRDVIQLHDVKHIKTFKTADERIYESWHYGKTSVTRYDVLVKCTIRRVTKSIEIMASGNDPGEITGLLAKIGHDLTKEFEKLGKVQPVFNLHIKDYIIQRSNLLSLCDLDGNCSGTIVIENSVIQRSNADSKIRGKKDQSEKEEEESILREEEQQTKIGHLRRKQDDRGLLEREEERPEKNIEEEEMVHGESVGHVRSHREEEEKTHKKEDHEHESGQKEQQEKESCDMIEIIQERSRQRINVKTIIINKTQELSNSGYQEERGVNFEVISVDKLVESLTHNCKNTFYIVDEFPIENGRLLYLARDLAGEKAYYLLTVVVREYEGLTQVLLRANSDKNYGVNGSLNVILDNLRYLAINASAREIGIISQEQVIIIIDSVVHRVEEERARRKREEQERLHREEEAKKREKKEQELKEQEEKEQKKEPKEAKRREKAKQEQECISKADLSSGEKKEGLFRIMFLAVMIGLLGYWGLAPFASDSNQSLRSSPTFSASFTDFNGMEFVLIPAGEFDMGSPLNEANRVKNEGPVHNVKIPNAFYMGKYEVTQEQWRKVMGNNPSTFKGDDLPVEQVSWNDAQEFIMKLNENEHVNKYRLPTEVQWEYAARAGTTMMYSFGYNESKLGEYAWYIGNSEGTTHAVGLKKPNPFGLYDMHGNVYEWVQDSYYDSYKVAPKDPSLGEYVSLSRVFRGGSWISNSGSCRLANREENDQGKRFSNLGFRLVRDL